MEIKVEWRDIPNFTKYMVSNTGLIKSKERITKVGIKHIDNAIRKEFIINGFVNKKGYRQVTLYDDNNKPKTMRVHKIVAQTFIPNVKNKPCINHIDGNKLNNNVFNLEWCTISENNKHSIDTGLVDKQLRIENMRKIGKSGKGLISRFGVTENLKKICDKRTI